MRDDSKFELLRRRELHPSPAIYNQLMRPYYEALREHFKRHSTWSVVGNTGLQLDVRNVDTADDAAEVARVVSRNDSIKQLSLSGNNIGVEGAKALAAGITASRSLAYLDLDDNDIGDKGAKAIADAVAASRSLATLDLADNEIGDEGAEKLAHAVGRPLRSAPPSSVFFLV